MADFHHPLFTKRSSATLSKKPPISAGKNGYDDVFGGPPKFSDPRIDDYAEIFGGFYAHRTPASIPVLDFLGDGDDDLSVDVRSPNFDYSEVFGGFDSAGDFAISFDEMFAAKKTSAEFRCVLFLLIFVFFRVFWEVEELRLLVLGLGCFDFLQFFFLFSTSLTVCWFLVFFPLFLFYLFFLLFLV